MQHLNPSSFCRGSFIFDLLYITLGGEEVGRVPPDTERQAMKNQREQVQLIDGAGFVWVSAELSVTRLNKIIATYKSAGIFLTVAREFARVA